MLAEAASRIEGGQAACLYRNCVRIGGVSLALTGASANAVRLSHELKSFRDEPESPDIEVKVEWVQKLQPWRSNPVFDSGALWALFRDGPELVFDFTSPVFGDCAMASCGCTEHRGTAKRRLPRRETPGSTGFVYCIMACETE